MKVKLLYLAAVLALLISMTTALIPSTPLALAQTPVSGTFSATGGSGNGTWNTAPPYGVLSGIMTVYGSLSGDVTGATTADALYNPADQLWYASSEVHSGNLTVGSNTYPARYYGKGVPQNGVVQDPGWPGPAQVTFDVTGYLEIWTTDGSNIFVYGTMSGSGSVIQAWSMQGTWTMSEMSQSGTWTGSVLTLASEPQVSDVTPGSGTVELAGTEGTVAQLDYDTASSGTIILAQFAENPGGATPKPTLDTFVEVDATMASPEINWPVELRIYYSDAEVSAAGVNEGSLRMYRWNGSSWVQVSDSGVNTSQNYVWARLTSFSPYAAMEAEAAVTGGGGGGCFIATAAYGSYLDSHVHTLRDFRDTYMVTNPVGRSLVSAYYRLSPPIAQFIDDHPSLKPIVRVGLLPAVAMSTVAIDTTPVEKMAILAGTALVSVALVVCLRRKAVKGGF